QAGYGTVVRLTSAALTQLGEYPWPGNLRELRNLLERLSVAHPGELIDVAALPLRYRGQSPASEPVGPETVSSQVDLSVAGSASQGLLPVNGIDLKGYLAELEQSLIEQALRDSDSVVARAADRLHIRRTTLVEKMRKYGIERRAH
ncbi:MAG: helix-turn-helix domain-containing protein, partial [Pseudomonadota bacterium]